MPKSLFAVLPPKISEKNMLKPKEVADRCNIHLMTVYAWAQSGKLPCIRLSPRALRFYKSDVENFLKNHTTGRLYKIWMR